jgi:hypothetical protein
MQSLCCGYGHDEGQFSGPDYTFLMVLECIIGHSRDSKLELAGVFNAKFVVFGDAVTLLWLWP